MSIQIVRGVNAQSPPVYKTVGPAFALRRPHHASCAARRSPTRGEQDAVNVSHKNQASDPLLAFGAEGDAPGHRWTSEGPSEGSNAAEAGGLTRSVIGIIVALAWTRRTTGARLWMVAGAIALGGIAVVLRQTPTADLRAAGTSGTL